MTDFYARYLATTEEGDTGALDSFGISSQYAAGFAEFIARLPEQTSPPLMLKGQVTGPFTLGTNLFDQDRRCSYYDDQLRDMIVKTAALKAMWQMTRLSAFGLRVMVFLDDDMKAVPELLTAHLRRHAEGQRLVVLGNVRRAPEVQPTALVRYLDSRGVHKLKPEQPVTFRYFATGNASVEQDLLMVAGLFDERFREFGGEDLELGYRLNRAGARFVYSPEARTYRTDYRDIPELCKAMVTYGESSLPIILETHPQLKELVKAHLLEPARLLSESFLMSFKKVSLRLVLWRPWGPMVALLARLFNRLFVPAILFDYLILFHYLKGVRRSGKG